MREATEVALSLHRLKDELRLRLVDDGVGIGADAEGAGIRGMRERALLVGASLDIAAGAKKGTVLTLTVPITAR